MAPFCRAPKIKKKKNARYRRYKPEKYRRALNNAVPATIKTLMTPAMGTFNLRVALNDITNAAEVPEIEQLD
jgi:hypothetical protein